MSPPRADPNREWKKFKVKTEDLLTLLNSGFIREKEVDMWRSAAGDPYPMEKAEDEIPMFSRFVELWDGHMVAGGRGNGAEASSSRAGPPASGEERVDEPPSHFVDAQEEQRLWEELRDHGASLNRALNKALRIHDGPARHVFQARRSCLFIRFHRFHAYFSWRGAY
jgi:hypothetical protein